MFCPNKWHSFWGNLQGNPFYQFEKLSFCDLINYSQNVHVVFCPNKQHYFDKCLDLAPGVSCFLACLATVVVCKMVEVTAINGCIDRLVSVGLCRFFVGCSYCLLCLNRTV